MSFVEFHDEKKIYHMGEVEIPALQGVNFEIEKGEFCIIVGPSGAGKTTVLNMLGGMDTCDEGHIWLDGKEVSAYNQRQLTEYRRYDVGFVFQFYNLVPNLTALENVELASQICPDHFDPEETLRKVGLGERMDNFPAQLSGGEQQRVAIARALVNDPAVILADEATGNLDTRTSFEILVLFQRLHAEGRTIIFVTHNPEIAQYSSRNITLRDGHVTADTVNTNILSAAEALARLPKNDD